MQKITLTIFLILTSIILLVFIGGIIFFIIQYRKRKLEHEMEKNILQEEHQLELMQTRLESQLLTMQYIGREIHDSVGQKLTLASLYSNRLPDSNRESIKNLIDESLQELRLLSKSLTDPSFADLSILELLEKEASRINASGACYVSLIASEKNIPLQLGEKNILFRLLQEFLHNSLKHGACRNIKIMFAQTENAVIVTAKDDGKGFNIDTVTMGSGLYNMKRRSEELNAAFSMNSSPGNGTELTLTIPV